MLWLLWIGRARHPGPFSDSMTVEVFFCGRLAYSWGYGVGGPC